MIQRGHDDILVFKASHVIYTTREWKKMLTKLKKKKKKRKTTERHTRKDKEDLKLLNSNFVMQLMVSTLLIQ